jgi:hypothetical protein
MLFNLLGSFNDSVRTPSRSLLFFKYNLCFSPSSVCGDLDHSFDQLLGTWIRGGGADHVLVIFLLHIAGDPKLAP